MTLVATGILLTAVASQFRFYAPWSPVPYTAQTAAVLLIGTAYGLRLGATTLAAYALVGIMGAPVFAGGAYGVGVLLGPTGGYLIGFIVAAALTGRLAERGWGRSTLNTVTLMVLGNLAIYVVGVAVLTTSLRLDPWTAITSGALVFLPWDAAKIVLAAILLPAAWHFVSPSRPGS